MFDVGDSLVLTFGNCVLKAGVIKWPVKIYVLFTFLTFFKIQKHDFLRLFELLHTFFSNTGHFLSVVCNNNVSVLHRFRDTTT